MSWYQTLKTAGRTRTAVVVEPAETEDYYSVGHLNFNNDREVTHEEMWVIDRNWEWDDIFAGTGSTHFNSFDRQDMRDKQFVARGRYSKDDNTVSVVYGFLGDEWERPRAFEFKKERVIKMIEEHYGPDVRIKQF